MKYHLHTLGKYIQEEACIMVKLLYESVYHGV